MQAWSGLKRNKISSEQSMHLAGNDRAQVGSSPTLGDHGLAVAGRWLTALKQRE